MIAKYPEEIVNSATVINLFPKARGGIVRTMLPWAQGKFREGMSLVMGDQSPAWCRPVGARWPDGSVRFTEVEWPQYMSADSTETAYFYEADYDTNPPVAFETHPSVLWGIHGATFAVQINGETVVLSKPSLVDKTSYTQVYECQARMANSPFYVELRISLLHKCTWVRFGLWITNTDPSRPETTWKVDEASFHVRGLAVRCSDEEMKVLFREQHAEWTKLSLLKPGNLGDGQGTYIEGVMAGPGGYQNQFEIDSADAEAFAPMYAVANTWPQSKTYGIFGYVPERPTWMPNPGFAFAKSTECALADTQATLPGEPLGWYVGSRQWAGMLERPGTTGEQYPFGDTFLTYIARTGNPAGFHSVSRAVRQEACRPIFFREANGDLFRVAKHPGTWFWTCRPFFINGTIPQCEDTLGKKSDLPDWDCARSQRGEPWFGYDRQHFDPKGVIFYAMLSADRWALRVADYYCDVLMANLPLASGNATADGFEAERAVDRCHHTGANLWLLTGRQDIKDHLARRVHTAIIPHWAGQFGTPIKVMDVRPAGEGVIPGEHWLPWQAAMSVRGLYATWLASHDTDSLAMAKAIARTVVMHGYVKRVAIDPVTQKQVVSWQIGKNCAWNSGHPLTDAQKNDPNLFAPADGTDYAWWGLCAALLSVDWASEAADGEWRTQAMAIVSYTLRQRTPPNPSEFIPLSWDEGKTEWTGIVDDPFSWPDLAPIAT